MSANHQEGAQATSAMGSHTLGFTAVYDPHSLSAEDFKASFTARLTVLDNLTHIFAGKPKGNGHQLIVASRGMGKTSLLRRLGLAIKESDILSKAWIPISYREEQYNINGLHVFWRNTCDSLAQWCEDNADQDSAELLDDMAELTETDTAVYFDAISRVVNKHQRRLILLVDNVNVIFKNLNEKDQWSLRKILSSKSGPVMIAASPVTIKALSDSNKPFYDFFHTVDLEPLTLVELKQCLLHIAAHRGAAGERVKAYIADNVARLTIFHTYTAGNPRTLVLMYRVIEGASAVNDSADDDFMPMLSSLIESVTPLYKAITEELSPQQIQVIDAVALHWDPITAANIATISGLPKTSLPPLLKRLRADGLIEDVTLSNNKKALQLRERFYNVWYLMRHGSRRGKNRLVFLTRAIEDLLDDKLKDQLGRRLTEGDIEINELNVAYARALPGPHKARFFEKCIAQSKGRENELLTLGVVDDIQMLAKQDIEKEDYDQAIVKASFLSIHEESNKLEEKSADAITAQALLGKSVRALDDSDYLEALSNASDALALTDKGSVFQNESLLLRALSYAHLGSFDEAIQDCSTLIELPDAPVDQVAKALFNRGLVYGQQEKLEAEIKDYSTLITLPDAPVDQVAKALFNRGVTYDQQGKFEAAIKDFSTLITLSDAPVEQVGYALLNRGFAYGQQGKIEVAIKDYSTLITLPDAPVDPVAKALFNRGVTYAQQEKFEAAIKDYSTLITLPDAPVNQVGKALFNRGFTYGQQGKIEAAIKDYSMLITLPDAPVDQVGKAFFNRGVTYGQQGKVEAEIKDYSTLITLPDAPVDEVAEALFYRGQIYTGQGKYDTVRNDYENILTLTGAPDEILAKTLNSLGNLHLDYFGDFVKSEDYFERALQLNSDVLYPAANLAWLSLFSNKLESYRQLLPRLDNLEPVGLGLLKSGACVVTDNFGEAFNELEQVLTENHDSLWSSFQDDLLRLVRLFQAHNYGEKLLTALEDKGFKLKQAPFYHAVEAYVLGGNRLNDINPELRSAAKLLYDWLVASKNQA